MDHYSEVLVALLKSVVKNCMEVPPGEKITMMSYPACNKTAVSRKPCNADKNTIDHYQENVVALSESWRRSDDDVMSG